MTTPERISRRILIGISLGVLVVALVFAGFYIGYKRGVVSGTDVVVSGVVNGDGQVEDADFNLFWEAWQKLRDNHIDSDEHSNQELVYGAISGLTSSFGDPHTVFFPPQEAEKFAQDVAGNFGGIGAEIGYDDNGILSVIAPLKGGPAEGQGLLSGDLIVKIDDKSTTDMSVDEAVSYIRGVIGTPVTLNIYRKGWVKPRDIRIVRENIKIPTLDVSFKEEGRVAYIQLYSFNENALAAFARAAREVISRGADGIVLDLRNNPGGYLDVAVRIAGLFIESGETVVSEQLRDGTREPLVAEGTPVLKDIPLVVLINGGSASASEILAGALRDIKGTKLVGEKSYGKGTVQEIKRLSDDSSMKVTIARWVMPAGGVLDKVGIEPDYVVEVTEEDIKAKKDVQLEKALEIMRSIISQ